MVLNDPSVTVNTLLYAGVVLILTFYRRGDSRRRPWVFRLAWLLTVICSTVPLTYLCGIYPYSSWATTGANIIFLSALVSVRGNVTRPTDTIYKQKSES